MARRLRVEFAGACYHVINRGNYRREIFAGKGAADSFQACLGEAAGKFGWRLHAFIILWNHFHLAVETPEPNLSDGMKWLQGTWVARFNRYHGVVGRPFQGRYKALHVEPGHTLAQVAHYIHLNPARARRVPVERLLEYRWSSLPLFLAKERRSFLEAETILRESGGLADTVAGWRSYLDYLALRAEEDPKKTELRSERMSRGWALGSADFKAELRREYAKANITRERFELVGVDRIGQREARSEIWEEQLQSVASRLGIALDALPPAKSALLKVRLAYWLKQNTSVSNQWLARRLNMGQPGSVTQYVRRFHARNAMESSDPMEIVDSSHMTPS